MLPTTHKFSFRAIAPYLAIAAVLVLLAVIGRIPAVRVGDGSEYYGLYHAWAFGHRPWMTRQALPTPFRRCESVPLPISTIFGRTAWSPSSVSSWPAGDIALTMHRASWQCM
jgi:hypothetical protein